MGQVKAPEKIYIPRLEGNETFVHEWSATKFRKYFSREVAENIEYTRTDTFIEKADEFISTFFHPDDTKLIGAVLNRFHEHMKLK
jgi:hypothetical protein